MGVKTLAGSFTSKTSKNGKLLVLLAGKSVAMSLSIDEIWVSDNCGISIDEMSDGDDKGSAWIENWSGVAPHAPKVLRINTSSAPAVSTQLPACSVGLRTMV